MRLLASIARILFVQLRLWKRAFQIPNYLLYLAKKKIKSLSHKSLNYVFVAA
jgi:hypothetical protein